MAEPSSSPPAVPASIISSSSNSQDSGVEPIGTLADGTGNVRRLHGQGLQISLPSLAPTIYATSSAHASPAAQTSYTALPQSTTIDPNVSAAVDQFNVQQSTMAFLHANMSGGGFQHDSRRPSPVSFHEGEPLAMGRGAVMHHDPPARAGTNHNNNNNNDGGLSCSTPGKSSSKDPTRGLKDSIQMSSLCSSPINDASHNNNNNNNDEPITPVHSPMITSPMESNGSSSLEEDSGTAGMNRVLEKAVSLRGLRLTWLLNFTIASVIVLFILLFVQILHATNTTLVETSTHVVQSKIVTSMNNAEVLMYDLNELFNVVGVLFSINSTTSLTSYFYLSICTRILGAPIMVMRYDDDGNYIATSICPRGSKTEQPIMDIPDGVGITSWPILMSYSDDRMIAARSIVLSHSTITQLVVVLLDKSIVGRFLLNTDSPDFSLASLLHAYTGFMLRDWQHPLERPRITLHSVTRDYGNYTLPQPTALGEVLQHNADSLCSDPHSRYLWNVVVTPNRSQVFNHSVNRLPSPHKTYNSAWGLLSQSVMCGVVCINRTELCGLSDPTSISFMVDYHVYEQRQDEYIMVVGVFSIAAVCLFSIILVVTYISISVPVDFLRHQLVAIISTNNKQTGTFRRKLLECSHRFWLGDVTSLIRVIYILGLSFRLTKKYVPDHVLRMYVKELHNNSSRLQVLQEIDFVEIEQESDEDDSNNLQDIAAFVNTVYGGEGNTSNSNHQNSSVSFNNNNNNNMPGGGGGGGMSVRNASSTGFFSDRQAPSPMAGGFFSDVGMERHTANNSIDIVSHPSTARDNLDSVEQRDSISATPDPITFFTAVQRASVRPGMFIKRDDETTILCVRLNNLDNAYLLNYALALKQHRRIMKFLLARIRQKKGAVFYRSGECLGAVWNGFESCPSHAAHAAACAIDISRALGPYRTEGLQLGIVLHQGTYVCGTVDDSKEAFATAFGATPRQAIALAELAATQRSFNIIVTEPVKQSLSSQYECIIVDVIQTADMTHPLILFELGPPRTASAPSLFAVEYAKAFYHFRNHDFHTCIELLRGLRRRFRARSPRQLERLEALSHFFLSEGANVVLPQPYVRPFPAWIDYELMAQMRLLTNKNSTRTTADGAEHKDGEEEEGELSGPSHSINLFPHKSLPLDEDINQFKKELHDNVRKLYSPMASIGTMPHTSATASLQQPTSVKVVLCEPKTTITPPKETSKSFVEEVGESAMAEAHKDVHNENNNNDDDDDGGGEAERPTTSAQPPCSSPTSSLLHPEQHSSSSHGVRVSGTPTAMVAMSSGRHTSAIASEGGGGATTPGAAAPSAFSAAAGEEHPLRPPPSSHNPTTTTTTTITNTNTTSSAETGGQEPDHLVGTMNSIIQSVGFSFVCENDSALFPAAMGVAAAANLGCDLNVELPATIHARNGVSYLRSSKLLGTGSFGSVFLGMDSQSGKLVAVKFLPLPSNEEELQGMEAEVLIMHRVKDSHVVELISSAIQGKYVIIVMECMMAGSLQNMMSAFHCIPSATARLFMRDVLRGLAKLHSLGIIHRDVKPQNVLLTLTGNCKISDFGASAWLQELARKESQGQVLGTPVYLSPEAARGKPEKESDLWSCGIMYLQLISGRLPYPDAQLALTAPVLVYQIGAGVAVPLIPSDLDELDCAFVRTCLRKNPAERLTAEKLLQMPLFAV